RSPEEAPGGRRENMGRGEAVHRRARQLGDLSDASKAWTEKVQSPVSAEAGRFTETYSKVDDYWQGRAAEAYKKVIKPEAPQSAATEQYADTAKEISSALNTCKLAIIGFWLAVGIAYSALIYTL